MTELCYLTAIFQSMLLLCQDTFHYSGKVSHHDFM